MLLWWKLLGRIVIGMVEELLQSRRLLLLLQPRNDWLMDDSSYLWIPFLLLWIRNTLSGHALFIHHWLLFRDVAKRLQEKSTTFNIFGQSFCSFSSNWILFRALDCFLEACIVKRVCWLWLRFPAGFFSNAWLSSGGARADYHQSDGLLSLALIIIIRNLNFCLLGIFGVNLRLLLHNPLIYMPPAVSISHSRHFTSRQPGEHSHTCYAI